MVIIRIFLLWVMIVLSVIIAIVWLIVYYMSGCNGPIPFLNELRGQPSSEPNQQQRLNKMQYIPVLGNFLATRARSYNPSVHEGDIMTKECCICFDEFSESDKRQLVELDCSNKHIFHLECM